MTKHDLDNVKEWWDNINKKCYIKVGSDLEEIIAVSIIISFGIYLLL